MNSYQLFIIALCSIAAGLLVAEIGPELHGGTSGKTPCIAAATTVHDMPISSAAYNTNREELRGACM